MSVLEGGFASMSELESVMVVDDLRIELMVPIQQSHGGSLDDAEEPLMELVV
jgi:hypothetical protein